VRRSNDGRLVNKGHASIGPRYQSRVQAVTSNDEDEKLDSDVHILHPSHFSATIAVPQLSADCPLSDCVPGNARLVLVIVDIAVTVAIAVAVAAEISLVKLLPLIHHLHH
jgi:hypothetical protein